MALACVHPAGHDDAMEAFYNMLMVMTEEYENLIVMGDFNTREYEKGIIGLSAILKDSWRTLHPIPSMDSEEMKVIAESEGTGFKDGGPLFKNRIDYIFVSDSFIIRESVYVPDEQAFTDHPAHWARIAF